MKITVVGVVIVCASASVVRGDSLTLNRAEYADRLRGMWLGECLANWTGRMTEGSRRGTGSPFYTDASWGTNSDTNPYVGQPIGFNFQSPWLTDDDTDVEYMYVHLMSQSQNPLLTNQQLTDGWRTHATQWLFYSNGRARDLLNNRNVSAASTGLPAANQYSHYIDAQLTTEVFGALAPGRPDKGLQYGMAPMLMTSRGYATHASQYFNSMYSLAARVPSGFNSGQKMRWLNDQARGFIPDSSKTADIIDYVVADFTANPDINDWERTRNKIYERYQTQATQAGANGFMYRDWTESSVNLATGVMALLYGNGDYKRTVQIATLSGWDSDNSTASLGGLFGLVHGRQHIIDQFNNADFIDRFNMQSVPLSDDFHVRFTGLSNMPDYVPGTTNVEDTFTMLANRMLTLVDKAVEQSGGTVSAGDNTWTIPLLDLTDKLAQSPTEQMRRRSANNAVRAAGGTVLAGSSATAQSPADAAKLQLIADGFETDFSGKEYSPSSKDGMWYSTFDAANTDSTEQWLSVTYSQSVWAEKVRLIEGDDATATGGFFDTLRLELFLNGQWTPAPAGTLLTEALDPTSPFQILDFVLPYPIELTAIRVLGESGSSNFAVTAAELDVILVPEPALGALFLLAAPLLRRRSSSRLKH